jgi:hypothetical protein
MSNRGQIHGIAVLSIPEDWGVAMLAEQEWQAVPRRLFEALCERLPDLYLMLIVLVVAPLAIGAFLIAFMIHQTNVFDAIGHHSRGFADAGVTSAAKNQVLDQAEACNRLGDSQFFRVPKRCDRVETSPRPTLAD